MASHGAVGFVGLDDLSFDMAASLLRSGYSVQAFEKSEPLMDNFLKLGGTRCASPMEAGKDVGALVLLIYEADQINTMIFGHDGALKGLQKHAVVILHSAILQSHIQRLQKHLTEDGAIISLVDIYVLRGLSESLNGKLIIASSGSSDDISRARPVFSAICENLYNFEGEVGCGRKIKTVIKLLEGIHYAAALEAISLCAKVGIHPWIVYDILSNSAGNSWIFKNHIPQLLKGIHTKHNFLNTFVHDLGIVSKMARLQKFPLPLFAVARQQLILGSSHGTGDDGDATLVKVWDELLGENIIGAANGEIYSPEQLARHVTSNSKNVSRVGFIGLGAMGFGMTTDLLRLNFCVVGYDVYEPTLRLFDNAGGLVGKTPAEVAKDVDVLLIMVANETQAESVLFGDSGAISALQSRTSIILSSTVSPGYVTQLEQRLQCKGLHLVDAPVSGGVKRASDGTLMIMASGTDEALHSTGLVLSALSEKLYIIKGGCGVASCVKMINQLLAGVHIASAAEAMAFGARLGLNTRILFDVIRSSSTTSWMFENRVPHMLDNDYTPRSALDVFVKDLVS